ncbi:MAG: hypothetical protein A2Y56_08470 [Candidatus Aminicenantes bacterium RBG_13_63_10]|nr:MAG: hypothetical protein A2Y56_08470 [Candidatus Aminicenantes bacterium RBG_13_63_10]
MNKQTAVIAFIALSLMVLMPGQARVTDLSPTVSQPPPPSDSSAGKHPKLESGLWRLARVEQTSGAKAALDEAARLHIPVNLDDTLRIVIETPGQGSAVMAPMVIQAMSQYIASLGGRVETTHGRLIQASVPVSALQALADSQLARFVRRPLRPQLHTVSEGVAQTGAADWVGQPSFHGGGSQTKVAILDLGFQGYQSLLGNELPSSVTTRSFRWDGDIEAGQEHGAACAEIVHDMAPDVSLYLVNFDTDVEQHNAVDWLIQQGVQVVSYSIGWTNAGAGDGTGPIDADVENAYANGLAWAGSAGNAATDHYEGVFSDPDSDGWHNFSGTDELLEFTVPAYETVGAFLNWDDWGTWTGSDYTGSHQDYDLYLYQWTGSSWVPANISSNPQTGDQWPTEETYGDYASTARTWAIAIRRISTTRNCNLEVFIWGNSSAIEHNVPWGSLNVPSDSPYGYTAGAVDWSDDSYHYYSSRGPTHDGRIKPDFACPSGVSSRTYGTMSFYGTSASAPHLAGAFGLILSRTPYTRDEILSMLQLRAVDLGTAGKDNMYGWGRLNLKK